MSGSWNRNMVANNPINKNFGINLYDTRPPYNLDLIDGRTVPKQ